jgi:hypothetical protein
MDFRFFAFTTGCRKSVDSLFEDPEGARLASLGLSVSSSKSVVLHREYLREKNWTRKEVSGRCDVHAVRGPTGTLSDLSSMLTTEEMLLDDEEVVLELDEYCVRYDLCGHCKKSIQDECTCQAAHASCRQLLTRCPPNFVPIMLTMP